MLKLLFNPLADGGNGEEASKEAEGKLKATGREVERLDSTTLDLDELTKKLKEEDEIAILGGDGTLNYFINHVKEFPKNKIYLYPSGTGNDFLNSIKDDKPVDGLLYLLNDYLKGLPHVEVKGKTYRFINGIGFGIDGECCVKAEEKKASGEKDIDYSKITISLLMGPYKPRTATIKVDNKEPITIKKTYMAASMNGGYYGGGMNIAPKQKRNSGLLTIVSIHGRGKLGTLLSFPKVFAGKHQGKKYAFFDTGKCIEVTFDVPCGLQIDGEVVSDVTSYKAYID